MYNDNIIIKNGVKMTKKRQLKKMQEFLEDLGLESKINDCDGKLYCLDIKEYYNEIAQKSKELGIVFIMEQNPHYDPLDPHSLKGDIVSFSRSYYFEEAERYEFTINLSGQADIIDKVESKEKNAICIYNDLGVPPYSSAKAVCALLNEKEEQIKELGERIKELEEENTSMKSRIINAMIKSNKVVCDCGPCVCEDYVSEELKKW